MARDSDWYIQRQHEGLAKTKQNSSDGNFLMKIKMNHEGVGVLALQVEGVRLPSGELQLSIITPDDVRREVMVTTPKKEEVSAS